MSVLLDLILVCRCMNGKHMTVFTQIALNIVLNCLKVNTFLSLMLLSFLLYSTSSMLLLFVRAPIYVDAPNQIIASHIQLRLSPISLLLTWMTTKSSFQRKHCWAHCICMNISVDFGCVHSILLIWNSTQLKTRHTFQQQQNYLACVSIVRR